MILVLGATLLSWFLAPQLAKAGGCSGPTVAVIDLSPPPRAADPATKASLTDEWAQLQTDEWARWQTALQARSNSVRATDFRRKLTARERRSMHRFLRGTMATKVPKYLRTLPGDAEPDGGAPRIDTVILVHRPVSLQAVRTVAVVGLHEGRVAALLQARYLKMTPSLIESLLNLASETSCGI